MTHKFSFSFDKRYLVVGVLIYILSAYIAIDLNLTQSIELNKFLFCTAAVALAIFFIYFILRIFVIRKYELRTYLTSALISVLVFIIGFSYCTAYVNHLDKKQASLMPCTGFTGMITEEPKLSSSGKSHSLVFDVYSATTKTTELQFDSRCCITVFVSLKKMPEAPSVGDCFTIHSYDLISMEPAFDGDFDYNAYLRQKKNLFAINAHIISPAEPLKSKRPAVDMLKSAGASIRSTVLGSSDIPIYDADEAALLRGILIGDTDGFSDELYNKYTNSGFIHIASVSGMHTSYLFMVIAFILSLVRFPRKLVLFCTIPILILFASVAMFSPSVCRAVIMLIILLIAGIIGRGNDPITAMFVAALLLSLENPYCLFSYSFLLSFGATLGILIYYPLLKQRLSFAVVAPKYTTAEKDNIISVIRNSLCKLNRYAVDSVCLSVGGTIGLAYFTARFFGKIQWGGIIGNILIFPFTAISFIGGYLNSIIYMVSPDIAEFIAKIIINPALRLTNIFADIFSSGIFRITTGAPPKSFFPVYLFICVVIYILLKPKEEKQ